MDPAEPVEKLIGTLLEEYREEVDRAGAEVDRKRNAASDALAWELAKRGYRPGNCVLLGFQPPRAIGQALEPLTSADFVSTIDGVGWKYDGGLGALRDSLEVPGSAVVRLRTMSGNRFEVDLPQFIRDVPPRVMMESLPLLHDALKAWSTWATMRFPDISPNQAARWIELEADELISATEPGESASPELIGQVIAHILVLLSRVSQSYNGTNFVLAMADAVYARLEGDRHPDREGSWKHNTVDGLQLEPTDE